MCEYTALIRQEPGGVTWSSRRLARSSPLFYPRGGVHFVIIITTSPQWVGYHQLANASAVNWLKPSDQDTFVKCSHNALFLQQLGFGFVFLFVKTKTLWLFFICTEVRDMDDTRITPNASQQHLMANDGNQPGRSNVEAQKSRPNDDGIRSVTLAEWTIVLILCFVNLINYMDRFTIAGECTVYSLNLFFR